MVPSVHILWEKSTVRRLTAVLVISAAVILQYFLANIPTKVDAATTDGYPQRAVNLGEHQLVIENPVVKPSAGTGGQQPEVLTEGKTPVDGLLLFHEGNPNEIIDVHFHGSTLSDGCQKLLTRLTRLKLPTDSSDIHYTTLMTNTTDSPDTCRTFIRIYLKAAASRPVELYLFQDKEPGYNRFRDLWMEAKGAQLIVDVNTVSPDAERPDDLPGCTKKLRVGEQEMKLPGSIPIEIIVPAESKLHLNFAPWLETSSLILGSDFQPFKFGSSPLRGRGMRIQRIQTGKNPLVLSSCSFNFWPLRCTEDPLAFAFHELQVDSNELRIKVSGEGFVKLDGKYKSKDFLEWAKSNWTLAALALGLNSVLLAWVKRIAFKRPTVVPLSFDDD